MLKYFYCLLFNIHTHMKQHIDAFHAKHNVRPYTFLLLGLFAVTNNALAAASLIQF